jgi:uncharacterized coiled-coil protein SlyX
MSDINQEKTMDETIKSLVGVIEEMQEILMEQQRQMEIVHQRLNQLEDKPNGK